MGTLNIDETNGDLQFEISGDKAAPKVKEGIWRKLLGAFIGSAASLDADTRKRARDAVSAEEAGSAARQVNTHNGDASAHSAAIASAIDAFNDNDGGLPLSEAASIVEKSIGNSESSVSLIAAGGTENETALTVNTVGNAYIAKGGKMKEIALKGELRAYLRLEEYTGNWASPDEAEIPAEAETIHRWGFVKSDNPLQYSLLLHSASNSRHESGLDTCAAQVRIMNNGNIETRSKLAFGGWSSWSSVLPPDATTNQKGVVLLAEGNGTEGDAGRVPVLDSSGKLNEEIVVKAADAGRGHTGTVEVVYNAETGSFGRVPMVDEGGILSFTVLPDATALQKGAVILSSNSGNASEAGKVPVLGSNGKLSPGVLGTATGSQTGGVKLATGNGLTPPAESRAAWTDGTGCVPREHSYGYAGSFTYTGTEGSGGSLAMKFHLPALSPEKRAYGSVSGCIWLSGRTQGTSLWYEHKINWQLDFNGYGGDEAFNGVSVSGEVAITYSESSRMIRWTGGEIVPISRGKDEAGESWLIPLTEKAQGAGEIETFIRGCRILTDSFHMLENNPA
ncbi:MAG: hypothetical protein PUB21_10915 [Bacteroidales bacterium]|nr:hypothetical protein [Bacteroidales bacterium]